MSAPIIQHYIPQFLLRNFKIKEKKGNEEAIFVFDKSTNREYQSPIKKVAAERHFYEVKTETNQYSIENELGKYESITKPIIQKVIQNKSIKSITKKEKMILSKFICLQILRVPSTRNNFSDLTEAFAQKFNFFEISGIPRPTPEEEKITHCNFVLNEVTTLVPFVYNKDWILCEAYDSSFIIGDNPVVMSNTFYKGRGNLGLKSQGIEIYMPISPEFCLLLVCNSIRKAISERLAHAPTHKELASSVERLTQLSSVLKRNETIRNTKENIIFVNSLQVGYAERFVYSDKKDFDLPKELIAEHGNGTRQFKIY